MRINKNGAVAHHFFNGFATAPFNENYLFSGWVINPDNVQIINNEFIMPAHDVTVTPVCTEMVGESEVLLARDEPVGDKLAERPDGGFLPAIIRVSEGMAPGMAVSVYGDYFTDKETGEGKVWVKMCDGDGNEWVIMPEQVDTYGQFLRFIWPDYIDPEVYIIKVLNDGGESWSVQEGYVNMPDGQWSNDRGAYTGMEINIFGRNLDASQYGGVENTLIRVI